MLKKKKAKTKSKPAPKRAKAARATRPEATETAPKKKLPRIPAKKIALIRNEYIADDKSTYQTLADKHGISSRQLKRYGVKEGWPKLRKEYVTRVSLKCRQRNEDKDVDLMAQYLKSLQTMAARLEAWANVIPPGSLEGISRELRETIKQIEKYIAPTVGQTAMNIEDEAEWEAWMKDLKQKDPEMFSRFRELTKAKKEES